MHGGRGSHIRLEMLTGGLCLWYKWYKGYTASTNVSALFDIPLGLLYADSGKKNMLNTLLMIVQACRYFPMYYNIILQINKVSQLISL